MSRRELEGKIAIVTGGSRGIGLSIAQALAEAGSTVAIIGRGGERAREAAAELPGDGHAGYACDVAVAEQVAETVKAIESDLGPVDILVNNA
ncbi:MAG: SDR family NAD(P)-dependent oxidoreductase, partial [Gemmatimonadota bacterium]